MKMFLLLTVILMLGSSSADTNFTPGSMCSDFKNSTVDPPFKANLDKFFSSLPKNVVINNGFYKTRVGKGPDGIYGIIQCRGDISSSNCANCTAESIKIASGGCPNSRDVTIWFKWCMLRYSNQSIFGVWEKTSMETSSGNATDDFGVSSEGLSMMSGLVSTTPNQVGMVKSSVINVGQGGKRYGLAQCRRDIKKSDCGKCLEDQLRTYRPEIVNQREWGIYGVSCSLWYNDFQFYSNISTLATSGGDDGILHGKSFGCNAFISSLVFMLIYLLT